jgi:hypothetical protein
MSDLIQAARLWQKTSANGRRYMLGRMGGLRVVILENQNRSGESEPSHFLFFGAADSVAEDQESRDFEQPRRRKAGPRKRRAPAADSPIPFDDPIPPF